MYIICICICFIYLSIINSSHLCVCSIDNFIASLTMAYAGVAIVSSHAAANAYSHVTATE